MSTVQSLNRCCSSGFSVHSIKPCVQFSDFNISVELNTSSILNQDAPGSVYSSVW